MPNVTIDIPGAILSRMEDGVATGKGRPDTIVNPANPGGPQIPNPQNKLDFLKEQVKEFLVGLAASSESMEAGNTAGETARTQARTDFDTIQVKSNIRF